MKIVGSSGLIGSTTAARLRKKGHGVAAPNSGDNTITGDIAGPEPLHLTEFERSIVCPGRQFTSGRGASGIRR